MSFPDWCLSLQNRLWPVGQPGANPIWISRGASVERGFVDAPLHRLVGTHAIQVLGPDPRRNQRVADPFCSRVHHGRTTVLQRTGGHGALSRGIDGVQSACVPRRRGHYWYGCAAHSLAYETPLAAQQYHHPRPRSASHFPRLERCSGIPGIGHFSGRAFHAGQLPQQNATTLRGAQQPNGARYSARSVVRVSGGNGTLYGDHREPHLRKRWPDVFRILVPPRVECLSGHAGHGARQRANDRDAGTDAPHLIDAMETGGGSHENAIPKPKSPLSGRIAMELQGLSARYEGKDEPVFEAVHHRFEAGQLSTIVGPSGSGKSTLVSMMLGLHAADQGEIRITTESKTLRLGTELSTADWLGHVAYLPQQPFLFEGTVRENLTLGGAVETLDETQVAALIDALDLRSALGENPLEFWLQEGGSNLSGGQQQRLALVRALQLNRPVLILDEATSSLDRQAGAAVLQLLQQEASRGTTVILITHDESVSDQHAGIALT